MHVYQADDDSAESRRHTSREIGKWLNQCLGWNRLAILEPIWLAFSVAAASCA
jgi:hypothetical protein